MNPIRIILLLAVTTASAQLAPGDDETTAPPEASVETSAEATANPEENEATPSTEGEAPEELSTLQEIDEIDVSLKGPDGGEPTPSQNVTVNLIRLLVKRGVLSHEDAVGLIHQAEREAIEARRRAEAVSQAAEEIRISRENEIPESEDEIRVTYVPEHVRQEIAADVRHEVMEKARRENWASPREFPEWTSRMRFFGDLRLRYEAILFPSGNNNTGFFPDFNEINTGAPFDVTGATFSPQYNVDQDRNRTRLRARIGLQADLDEDILLGMRIATGSGDSPVTTNQTMGRPGNFSKYNIWLDRAFIKGVYESNRGTTFTGYIGRFDNPFFATSMVWDGDLGFDGVAVQMEVPLTERVKPFVTAGAFPIYNTALNFPDNQPAKFESEDRYLLAAQVGTKVAATEDIDVKVAGAYYYFENVEGQRSTPFVPLTSSDRGDTDDLRPPFAQKGNTYMALRNILPVPANNFGTINQWQYFGLATPFRVLAFTGQVDFNHFEPAQISLYGEVAQNLAFNHASVDGWNVNNLGATPGSFDGGDTAWITGIKVGHPKFQKRWDWRTGLNYRVVETDALVDGFVDSDFGLGGTNVQGFSFDAAVALSRDLWVRFAWMSASEVSGPQFKSDIYQIDLSAKF